MGRPSQKSVPLQPLGPVLDQALRQAGLQRVVLLTRITQHWEEIVGSQIAAVAHPEAVRARVLFVTVADAIWLQQLTFYQAQLLRNVRRVLGRVPIGKLHFTLVSSPVSSRSGSGSETAPEPLPLTAIEARQVLEGVAVIADAELRRVVQRVWRRGLQLRR